MRVRAFSASPRSWLQNQLFPTVFRLSRSWCAEEVVERLASFEPTKIMVEVVPEQEAKLNATYRSELPVLWAISGIESPPKGGSP